MEILVFLVLFFLLSRVMGGGSVHSSRTVISCPYCHHSVGVSRPGFWRCQYCGHGFQFTEQGEVLREEEALHGGLEMLARLYAKISKADGVVTANELAIVEKVMQDLQLTPAQNRRFKEVFNASRQLTEGDYMPVVRELYLFFQDQPDILHTVLVSLVTLAKADGGITHAQQRIIDYATQTFSPSTRHQNASYQHHSTDRDGGFSGRHSLHQSQYQVLGVHPEASDSEIKNAYKKLIQQYHPDKHQSKNLPPDMIEYAANKFNEIQNAYEAIKRERNLH